ncbi:MAG TPA: glycosyltransferase family 2 protein [Gemmatimonadaceae bacterium]|nr:glycosyltransferase family 2 protein [Gemmatimonadaceae bacterium]
MSSGGTVSVSVVIAARNEAANIRPCIESVSWASEIIVVEDRSTDDTSRLATAAGARVIQHPFTTIGGQRNAAIDTAREDWVLVVDADERGSPELGLDVLRAIQSRKFNAYRVPRRNYFLGREVMHGGWQSDKPVRLFLRAARYNASRVHEHVDVTEPVGELEATLIHEPYPTIDSYFEKLDRYSKWWAEDRFDRGVRTGIGAIVLRPPARFLTMYLLRAGFLDGAEGAVLACMASTSVMAKYARLWAMGRRKSSRE